MHVLVLLQEKKLPARVDAVDMVLQRHHPDPQQELLEKTLEDGLRCGPDGLYFWPSHLTRLTRMVSCERGCHCHTHQCHQQ
jgi:hypothetical protein